MTIGKNDPEAEKTSVRFLGVGDLWVVRRRTLGYVTSDIAHIENAMAGEKRIRTHSRRTVSEEEHVSEAESETEDENESESTHKTSLESASSQVVSESSRWHAGVDVSASYGAVLSIQASAGYESASSSSSSGSSASAYESETIERALSRVRHREFERRRTLKRTEIEELNHHELSNATSEHSSGVYWWVDRLDEVWRELLGERAVIEIIVPEPSAFLRRAQELTKAGAVGPQLPPELAAWDTPLSERRAGELAASLGGVSIPPRPAPFRRVVHVFDFAAIDSSETKTVETQSVVLRVPDGYAAVDLTIAVNWYYSGVQPVDDNEDFLVASGFINIIADDQVFLYVPDESGSFTGVCSLSSTAGTDDAADPGDAIDGARGEVPVTVQVGRKTALAVSVILNCALLPETLDRWDTETRTVLFTGYQEAAGEQAQRLAFEESLGTQLPERQTENQERIELKRLAMSALVGSRLRMFGAVYEDAAADLRVAWDKMGQDARAIRFFERAFEWSEMVFAYYPYFWGRKEAWDTLSTSADVAGLVDFSAAGAARILLPIRPGYEGAYKMFRETNQWTGLDRIPQTEEGDEALFVVADQGITPRIDPPVVKSKDTVRVPTSLVTLNPSSLGPDEEDLGGDTDPDNDGGR